MKELVIKNLEFRYNDDENILDDINYTFTTGLYFLSGPNGVGKTTLLNVLSGVFSPTSGIVDLVGNSDPLFQKVAKLDAQTTDNIKEIKVSDFAKYIAELNDLEYNEIAKVAKRIDLSLDKKIKDLSKGNQRKVLLLPLLFSNAEVVMYDEPFDNIDQETVKILFDIFVEKSKDKIVIIVSHIASEVFESAHHLKLDGGKLYEI